MEQQPITFTPVLYRKLCKQYQAAVDAKAETFMFEGKYQLLTDYAKYLLEYLGPHFGGSSEQKGNK